MAETKQVAVESETVSDEDNGGDVVLFYDTAEQAKAAGSPNPKFRLFQAHNPAGELVGWTWARYNVFAYYNAARHAGYKVASEGGRGRSPEKAASSVAERMERDPAFRALVEKKAAEILAAKKGGAPVATSAKLVAPAVASKPTGKPRQLART